MSNLNKQNQALMNRLEELFTNQIGADDLAKSLERVIWGYSKYMLQDEDLMGHPDNTNDLSNLRWLMLRIQDKDK